MNLPGTSIRLAVLTLATIAFAAWSSPFAQSSPMSSAPSGFSRKARSSTSAASPQPSHWLRYPVNDSGRSIVAYVAHDGDPKPLLILLQGSGCAPLMTVDASGTYQDTSLFQDLIAPRLS